MSDPSEPKTTAPFSPTPYSVWATENPFENELEGRTKHLDNLRLEYIAAGKYNEDTEKEFQESFENVLIKKGILTQSNYQQAQEAIVQYSEVLPSNQKDVQFVAENMDVGMEEMDFEEGEQEKILRYAKALETGQELPEDLDANEVHEIARQKRQNYITELYENGELSAGVYFNKSGQRVFLGGKMDEGVSEAEILREGSKFGVVPRDIFSFRQSREVQKDKNGLRAYEVDIRERAQEKVEDFLDLKEDFQDLKDEKVRARFEALATALGKDKSWGWAEKGWDSTGEVFVSIGSNIRESWNWATGDDEEKKYSEDYQRFENLREEFEDDVEQTRRDLIDDLAEKTGLSQQILEDVVDDMVVEIAGNGSKTLDSTLLYEEDDDDLSQNTVRRKYMGTFVQPALMLQPEKFRRSLKQNDFSDEEIEIEDAKRLASNELLANTRSDILRADEDYAEKFAEAELQGKQDGLTQAEIVQKFVDDEDPNLGIAGIGMSIGQGFSTLYYGVGALFGAEYGKQGLLENAKDQAHLNQMRQIFGQDAGFFQQASEQIAPMSIDALVTFGAALFSLPSAGTSVAAAGGYFSLKQGATATAKAVIKNTFNSALKQQVRDVAGRTVKESTGAALRRLQASGSFKGLSNRQLLAAYKGYNSKLAKTLGIRTPQFGVAALRSGSMTYGAVHQAVSDDYTQRYQVNGEWVDGWSEERVKEVAHDTAYSSMIVAGTTTGLITAIAGKLGGGKYGGLESAVLSGVSLRTIKKQTDRMVGRVSSDKAFLKYMEDAVSSTFKEAGIGIGGQILRGAVGEAGEEFIDEFANSIVQSAWSRQDFSLEETFSQAIQGALIGGLMGAASPAIGSLAREVGGDRVTDLNRMADIEAKVEADFRQRLADNNELERFEALEETAPKTNAEYIQRVKARYAQNQAIEEGEESAETPEDSDEQTPEEIEEEAQRIADDAEANVKQDDQQKLINEEKKKKNPKGNASPIVTTSDAITDVTGTDPNPKAANADVTGGNPDVKPALTPQQKFEFSIKDIEARERKYIEAMKVAEQLPEALQAERLKEIEALVASGKLVSPETAGGLIKQATKAREKAIADEAKPAEVTTKDLDKLEAIIEQGFPVADIGTNLEQLGLDLERTDEKYLRAVEKVIKEKIAERYPTINTKKPDGGVRLPNTLVPSGTVVIDQYGNGVFNNDPAGMVTLLRNNVAIPLTEDQATNPNTNKSFVIEKQGDQYYVTDIMVPVKGGLISAKTPINKIGVHEPDYGPVKTKIRRLTTLKNSIDLEAINDVKVVSPFRAATGKKPVSATVPELLKEAKNFTALKPIITATKVKLDKDYVDAAAITMSLDLQEQIYNAAKEAGSRSGGTLGTTAGVPTIDGDTAPIEGGGEGQSTPSINIDLKASAIKNAEFFSKVQAERKSQAIRDVASLLEPNTDITKRPDLHDTEKQADRGFNGPRVQTIEPLSVPKISKYTASKIDDVATAIRLDERLRRDVKKLLNQEYHGGKKVTDDYSSEQVAVELVYFLASKGGTNKPAAILEQKLSNRNLDVINPEYKLGQDMKNALTLLGVTSPTMQGALDTDINLYQLIEAELQELVGKDVLLSYGDVKTFYTQVREQAHAHRKRAVNDGRTRKQKRRKNLREIAELGLLDDDPESVIDALEGIAESGHKPLKLLAKTLLKNKDLIRSVRFIIEGSPAFYAGVQYVDGLGQTTVIINVDRSGKRGVADTLIHEYLHVFTAEIFRTPPESRTEAQNEAVANLEELLRIAKPFADKSGKGNLTYGTSNIDEFLTHILTDPEFQSFLNRVIPAKGKTNLFQRAIRALAKLLGIRTRELRSALQDALDLTKRAYAPQPETKAAFASQAADRIHKSQADLHQMAKDMDMANDAAVNEKLEQRAEEIVEFAGAYIPSELNVVVDNASPEIATVDSATGALILNPKRAALYLANQGVSGLDAQRRKHAIGIILNKAVGQAAADTMISDTQYVDITKAMTQSELEAEIKEAYPLDEQQAAFDRLRSEDGKVAATERFDLAKKAIARHTELATTGRTTNQQMAFLQSNPSLIPTFVTYMKAFLSKLTYHRTLDDVSPEMRKAVNNTVREIRALSLNYKPAPSIMHHNPRDPYAVIEKLMEQAVDVNMLEPTADSPVTAASQGSVDAEYLAAVESGDVETQQRMVDEAAATSGIDTAKKLYRSESVDVKDTGGAIFFTEDVDYTSYYEGEGRRLRMAYMPTNILDPRKNDQANLIRGWIEEKIKSLEERYYNGEGVKSLVPLADAKRSLERGATPSLASAWANLYLADRNQFPAVGSVEKAIMSDLGFDAMYVPEFGRNRGEEVSVAFRDASVIKTADPVTRDADGNVIPLSQRFDEKESSIFASQAEEQPTPQPATGSQFSKDSKIPNFLDEVQMQEKSIGNWLEILDVPLLEFSKDYEFTKRNKVMKFLYKTFVRSADKRVVNFYDQNKAFVRETKGLVDKFQQKHNRILKAENERLSAVTGQSDNIPAELIARASGTTEGSQLTREQEDLVQASYEQDIAKAKALPTTEEKNAAIDIAEASKKQMTMDFRETNRKKQFDQRDRAMDDLLKISPDMYNLVLEMRQLQDQLSKKAIEVFGPTMNPEDLNMAFDFNRGLYLTRSYRMFEDRNFSKQVKESDQYAEVRERAVAYFMKQLRNQRDKELSKQGKTKEEINDELKAETTGKNSHMQSQATAMMNDFIDGYSQGQARKKFLTSQREMGQQDLVLQGASFGKNDPLQKIVETINEKKDIPQEIRELLGEFQEDTGIYNLSYSLNHTASMISNQAFFNKLKALGTGVNPETGKVEGTPWMVTQKEYLANRDKYPNWEPILTEGKSSDLNPLADMYVPKEVVSNLDALFGGKQPDITDPLNEMAEVQGMIVNATRKLVGYSLAYKTLGSPAFYIRNILGNMLFFGPMQGYPSHRVIKDFAKDASGLYTKNPDSVFYQVMGNELSFELMELRSRNIYGDELEVSQIQDLVSGKTNYESLQKDLDKVAAAANYLKDIKQKSGAVKIPDEHLEILAKAGVNVSKVGMMPLKALGKANDLLLKKGGLLASAADGFFKIGLYDFEMQTLIAAAQHDIENGKPNGKYGRLLDDDGNPNNTMKDLAAEIVKDTAQSYSRALPVIKRFTSSSLSIALAPYVRFAADVPRVYFNGILRARDEIFSDNPAIKARGRKRLFGATRTTAVSVALGKGTQMLLWGMDDEDEDKAFRAMVPKWMRNASIFLYKDSDGDTWSVDMTYLNPFAIVQDPAIRAVESLLRGEGIGTASKKFIGQFLRPYVSEQILTGALLDVFENEDQYGRPIRLAGDDDKLMRSLKYIGEKAFSPRSLMSADAAYDSFLSQERTASFFDSALGHLMKSVLPFRPHQQDYTAGVGRYLYNHTNEYRANDQAFRSKMTQQQVLPASEVREAYDRWVKTRLYLNNDFKQTIRGFEKLGVSRKDIERMAKSRSVSKERLKQNRLGYMVRPTPTKPLQAQLKETKNGRTRLSNLESYYEQKYPNEVINIEK